MNKKYFLCALISSVLIFGGFNLSYAVNTCPDNEKNINSSLSNLSNAVERIDMNNFLPDATIISESESSKSDDQTSASEVCEEIPAAAQPSSGEQIPPAVLAENNPADEYGLSDFLKEFSLLKEIHSTIVALASNQK